MNKNIFKFNILFKIEYIKIILNYIYIYKSQIETFH